MSNQWVWNTGNLNDGAFVLRAKLYKDLDSYTMTSNEFTNNFSYLGNDYTVFSHSYHNYEYEGEVFGTSGDDAIYGSTDTDVTLDGGTFGSDTPTRIIAQGEEISGKNGDDYIDGRDGDDTLHGNNHNDVIIGGDGTDSILGGFGNDVLVSSDFGVDSSDILKGGDGIDTFILGDGNLNEGETIEGGYDWSNLFLSMAGDISDFAFTLGSPGMALGGKLLKEVIPAGIDLIKFFMNGPSEDQVLEPEQSNQSSYIYVEDFNVTEDVVVVPLSDSNLADLKFEVEVWGDETGVAIYQDSDEYGLDMVAFLNVDDIPMTTDNTSAHDNLLTQLLQSAIKIDDNASSNWNGVFDYSSGDTNDDGEALTENLENNENYVILGAVGSQNLWAYDTSTDIHGTENYGDQLYAYTPLEYYEFLGTESQYQFDLVNDRTGDKLYGHGGNDFLFSGAGADILDGGDGSDTAVYFESPEGIEVTLSTNKAIDDGFGTEDVFISIENVVGSEHGDSIRGDSQANSFFGMGGDDSLYGEGGADTIDGGNDADLIYGGGGNDSIIGGVDYDPIDGNDTIYGEGGNDYIHGGDMNDYLDGGDGNDSMYGGSDRDTLMGGKNNDILSGGWGADLLQAGMGTDVIHGGGHNDTIYGEMGIDELNGGDGDDILNGGKGYDTMTGGAGADTFILGGNIKEDIITDFDSDEGDIIDIDKSIYGFSSVSDLTFDAVTGDLKVSTTGATIVTLENSVGFTSDDIYLDGVQNTDPFLVGGGIVQEGGNGNDYFEGDNGPDTLSGGDGDDTLIGYKGDDILTPGYGVDILTGGADADTFVVDYNDRPSGWTAKDNTTDVITDFSTGEDVIHIEKSAFSSGNVRPSFDYDSSSQSGILSVSYVSGNAALRSNLFTIENLASASEFNINSDVQLV